MKGETAAIAALVTVVGAVALSSPKKKRRKSSGPVVDAGGGSEVEIVPAPSEGTGVYSGYQEAPNLGGAFVDWWVASHNGGFGWQYAVRADQSGEMSYLDGAIYHYPRAEDALADLQEVLG